MKTFLLIMTIIYGIGIVKKLFSTKSQKEDMDETLTANKINTQEGKNTYIITLYILIAMPISYILLSIKFINIFWFAVIGILYLCWNLYDFNNLVLYLSNGIVKKVFNSKIYIKLSIPFDLGFVIYMFYQLYTRW